MGIGTGETSEGQIIYSADVLNELEIFRGFMYAVMMGGIVFISTGLTIGLVTAVVKCTMTNCKKGWLRHARAGMIKPCDIELARNDTTQTMANETEE